MKIYEYLGVANNLKTIRLESCIKQKELAKLLGIPVSTYSNYENYHREPPMEIILRVSEITNTPVLKFLEMRASQCISETEDNHET